MKVCLLTASIEGLGGVEAVVRQLASGLSRKGHRVLVITLDGDPATEPSDDYSYDVIYASSGPSDHYRERTNRGGLYKAWWQVRSLFNRELMQKLESAISGFGPDVIHTHKVRGFPRTLWPRLIEAAECPIVHTCHDIELLSPDHRISVEQPGVFNGLLLKAFRGFARKPSNSVSSVTSPSQFMLGLHLNRDFFPAAENEVIANGPDLDPLFSPNPLSGLEPGESLKLLFIGRLVEVKGFQALCEATVLAVNAGMKIELSIAGDGELRHIAERFSSNHEFIHFSGPVSGAEKAKLFNDCHVVVVPSQYDETFGIVAVEAITAARPALVSSRGGLPEVVRDGDTGWVYQDEGVEALLSGLKRVDACRDQLGAFSSRCIGQAESYSEDSIMDRYEAAYESLLTGESARVGD